MVFFVVVVVIINDKSSSQLHDRSTAIFYQGKVTKLSLGEIKHSGEVILLRPGAKLLLCEAKLLSHRAKGFDLL